MFLLLIEKVAKKPQTNSDHDPRPMTVSVLIARQIQYFTGI